MSKQSTNNQTWSLLGGIILLGIILSSWFPQPCPVLRKALNACPAGPRLSEPTADEKEINRIPHQEVKVGIATFNVKAEKDRRDTSVRFFYRGDLSKELAILEYRKNNGYKDLAIISHPLLLNLNWPSIYADGYRLYQNDTTYDSIENFLNQPPNKSRLTVDSIAANHYNMSANNYQALEDLQNLDNISYILTSYSPSSRDGSWYSFDRTFDATEASVNNLGNLEWAIYLPHSQNSQTPFLLSTVHIDYAKRNP